MENTNDQKLPTNDAKAEEQENLLGGTTNLSLDQLKQEGGIANFFEGNPDSISDEDDLNEIKAGDDLAEPDPEADDLSATGADEDDMDADTDDLDADEHTDTGQDDEADSNAKPII